MCLSTDRPTAAGRARTWRVDKKGAQLWYEVLRVQVLCDWQGGYGLSDEIVGQHGVMEESGPRRGCRKGKSVGTGLAQLVSDKEVGEIKRKQAEHRDAMSIGRGSVQCLAYFSFRSAH